MISLKQLQMSRRQEKIKGQCVVVVSGGKRSARLKDNCEPKLQALVYNILSSTTAVFSYAIGSRKLSAK